MVKVKSNDPTALPEVFSAASYVQSKYDFDSYYEDVIDKLTTAKHVVSLSLDFSKLKSDSDRMRFLFEHINDLLPHRIPGNLTPKEEHGSCVDKNRTRPPFKSPLFGDLHYEPKTQCKSLEFRTKGNEAYQTNKLRLALYFYTKSVLYAPHPTACVPGHHPMMIGTNLCSTSSSMAGSSLSSTGVITQVHQQVSGMSLSATEGGFEELALAYANRSAVLFRLKEYKACLRDISLALDHSYPNDLMFKLLDRKAKVHIALDDPSRALDAAMSAQMWLKHTTPCNANETKLHATVQKGLASTIQRLQKKIMESPIDSFDTRNNAAMMANLDVVRPMPSPPTFEDHNPEVPGLSKKVELDYTTDMGRSLKAKELIQPGEDIAVEQPYASALERESYETHCQNCLRRLLSPIPCWFCASVGFCCEQCRFEAWNKFHKVECHQLALITETNLGICAQLVMRILTSSGKIYIDYIVKRVNERDLSQDLTRRIAGMKTDEKDSCDDGNDRSNDGKGIDNEQEFNRTVGFNADQIYDTQDYRTVYTLVSNSDQRTASDLFKRALMALYCLGILTVTPFFYNSAIEPSALTNTDKIAVGALLLKHMQNVASNAHSVGELVHLAALKQYPKYTACQYVQIASGIYPILSLLNHSCYPNVTRVYFGQTMVCRANRTIHPGDHILDCYGQLFSVMNKVHRQEKLLKQYRFKCNCIACVHNWPRLDFEDTNNTRRLATHKAFKKATNKFTQLFFSRTFSPNDDVSELESALKNHVMEIEKDILKQAGNDKQKADQMPVTFDFHYCQETLKSIWDWRANLCTDPLLVLPNFHTD